jgi:hypothetical protein
VQQNDLLELGDGGVGLAIDVEGEPLQDLGDVPVLVQLAELFVLELSLDPSVWTGSALPMLTGRLNLFRMYRPISPNPVFSYMSASR